MTIFKFPLQAHQGYYTTQYGELSFSSITQMKDDYVTNSHYLTHTPSLQLLGECTFVNLGVKGLT